MNWFIIITGTPKTVKSKPNKIIEFMKTKLIIFLLSIPLLSIGQVKTPINIYFTNDEIKGNADPNTIIKIDRNKLAVTGLPIISVTVNKNGYFEYSFQTPLAAVAGVQPNIDIWAEDNNGNKSAVKQYTAFTTTQALDEIVNKKFEMPIKANNPEIDGFQLPSTTFKYKVKMLTTNFTVPIARFNIIDDGTDTKKGEISLFNSVGAGFGVSWGEIEKTTDANGSTLNIDYTNTFGLNLGFLFSSGKDGDTQKNIFAPTATVSILDFQIGFGYELGTTSQYQKKGFLTIAYAIPLSKLVKGKFYIFRASRGYNDKNPLPKGTKITAEKTSKQAFI
jgi:hypothetical protein